MRMRMVPLTWRLVGFCRKTLLAKVAILGTTHLPMVSLSLVGNMSTVRGIGWTFHIQDETGWLNDGGTWYWLQPSGAMFANGWLKIDGVDYYFNASGAWLNTSGSVLGVNRSSLVNWLMSHENDGYYRGTRYDTHLSQETCMYPKGDPRWDGYTGMNCGGFVSHAYMKAGGNLAPIAAEQSHSPWSGGPGRGGCVNAYRWYGYAIDTCANVTYFNSIDELLRSGLARKGDIVFFNPYNPYADDSHIGFFWGNSPSENLFWHSDGYGNRISGLTALGPSKVILIR